MFTDDSRDRKTENPECKPAPLLPRDKSVFTLSSFQIIKVD